MGSKSIVGKSVILGAKVKETPAGFEEDLYIPSLSIDPDDIFLAQSSASFSTSRTVCRELWIALAICVMLFPRLRSLRISR